MKFTRFYTKPEWKTPYDEIKFVSRTSEIKNPDGSQVFHMANVQVPEVDSGRNGCYSSKSILGKQEYQ